MRKICIFTSAHLENDVRIFKKQILSLLNNGYYIYYFTNKEKSNAKKEISGDLKTLNYKNLEITYNTTFNEVQRLKRFLKSLFFFLYLPKDCSIYHFHDPDLLFTGLILKMLGKKVIYDVHENYKETMLNKQYLPKYIRKLLSLTVSSFEIFCSRFYDLIICATIGVEERFINANIKKTVVINNFPIKAEFKPSVNENSIREDCIIYVGAITKMRGISYLVNSLNIVNKTCACRLKLAGEIAPLLYERELKSLDGWKYVDYYGMIKRSELALEFNKVIAGAVVLLPEKNYVNSLPTKLFEYMSASIPIIASSFPMWIDIVEKYNCGICVNPQSSEEIAGAIIELITHKSTARLMGENGRNLIDQYYNWESEEKKFLESYEGLYNKV